MVMTTTTSSTKAALSSASARRKPQVIFHWFRQGDLRLHDNPALVHSCKLAAATGGHVVPVYCFDTKTFLGQNATCGTLNSSLKTGPRRALFLQQSVADLQTQLATKYQNELVVGTGEPASFFEILLTGLKAEFASSNSSSSTEDALDVSIVCQREVVQEEIDTAKRVQSVLQQHFSSSNKFQQIWGSTMYELKDLPFGDGLVDMPNVFTPFRNKVEKTCQIPAPLPIPEDGLKRTLQQSNTLSLFRGQPMPRLTELGYTDQDEQLVQSVDPRGVMTFVGGETAALARVKEYIWDKDLLRNYFDTRNGMLGADYSTKFAPWLAHGCLSPRHVASECRKYEESVVANKSTYWVVFELLWRDYCKFFCYKHGNRVFYLHGIVGKSSQNKNSDKPWSTFERNFEAWRTGQTGYPLVDANMRELVATGFMSNRGRQNVASFLAIDLHHDWRMGGDLFETHLLDYDVYSNWYNWCAASGMTGGRLNRFNIVKQGKDYDQNGAYVRHWCPELKNVPDNLIHEPWKMTHFQQTEFQCRLGTDYPNPIIPPFTPKYNKENNKNGGGRGAKKTPKQRKPNNSNRNRHQKYEMKSLKTGNFEIK